MLQVKLPPQLYEALELTMACASMHACSSRGPGAGDAAAWRCLLGAGRLRQNLAKEEDGCGG
jgi:hypothetical protein